MEPLTRPESAKAGALETGLDVLEALSRERTGLGVTDLARRIGRDKANVHRLLKVLQERGYVLQDPVTKRHAISVQVLTLAGTILRGLDVRWVGQPIMEDLGAATGESVHLAYPTAHGAVYVAQERPGKRVSVETEIGSEAVTHCTATGKALVAFGGKERLAAALKVPLERFTPRTIVTVEEFSRELARVREQGYAVDDEEYNLGVRCVAAPIWGVHGSVVAAIGISGPAERLNLGRLDEISGAVVAAAEELSLRIGGRHAT